MRENIIPNVVSLLLVCTGIIYSRHLLSEVNRFKKRTITSMMVFLLLLVVLPNVMSTAVYTSKPKDYSCYHAESWLTNDEKHYNTAFSAYTDIISSGYISASSRRLLAPPPPPGGTGGGTGGGSTSAGTPLTTGWKVTFKGIPNYDYTFTAADVTTLNSRPKKSTDFRSNSATSAKAGDLVKFGTDINYATSGCVKGYWPPGPSCPAASDYSYIYPISPAKETSTTGCYTGNSLGYFVNGIPVWSWSDTASYNSAGVWHNAAMEFEKYDMDVCIGHAAQTVYHHHSYSPCLMRALNDTGASHSPIHGFAFDGYPIFGPYQAANELAVPCWKTRDYSASSSTGCGTSNKRTCVLKDQLDISEGTVTASSAGPDTTSTQSTMSGNSIPGSSGIYFEDYYYDATCYAQGGKYLDQHNGHDHDGIGYHYHLTMDSSSNPVFPYVTGPQFYGCLPSGSYKCALSVAANYLGTTTYGTSVCDGTSSAVGATCTSAFFNMTSSSTSKSPTTKPTTAAPTLSPSLKPTAMPSNAAPTVVPTTAAPSFSPSFRPTPAPSTAAPSVAPTATPTAQVRPIVSFTNTLTMAGVGASTLTAEGEQAITEAAADIMDVDSDDIKVDSTTLLNRRLFMRPQSAAVTIQVVISVVLNLVDYSTVSDASVFYTSLKLKLETAANDGTLTTAIKALAVTYGASDLTSMTSTLVVVNAATIDESDSSKSKTDSALSTNALIGIIVGVVGGCILIAVLVAVYVHGCSKGSNANVSPK